MAMNFEYSEKVQVLRQSLQAFLNEHVFPNEAQFQEQLQQGDRWQPQPIVESSEGEGAPRPACGICSCPTLSMAPD